MKSYKYLYFFLILYKLYSFEAMIHSNKIDLLKFVVNKVLF